MDWLSFAAGAFVMLVACCGLAMFIAAFMPPDPQVPRMDVRDRMER